MRSLAHSLTLSLAFTTLFLGFSPIAFATEKGPADITYETKMGAVTFPHTAHQGVVSDCTTCHHKGLESGACKTCHGVDPAAPKAKDAFHKQCKGCHKEMNKGPKSCKDCHKK